MPELFVARQPRSGSRSLEDELLDERFVLALIELKRQDHRLALDDFAYVSAERLVKPVDVVKVDLLALGREQLACEVAYLKPYGVKVLAEPDQALEPIGEQLAGPRPGELFALGLFTVIDPLMDAPMRANEAAGPLFEPDMAAAA
jgi:c-di-GMP-related signal transduction protein